MTVVVHVLEAVEGGTARHLSDLVRHVPGVTHHVAVPEERVGGATDHDAVARMAADGAVVHRVEMRRSPLSPRNASALWQLRGLIRNVQPDVVHGHSSVGGALARAALASRATVASRAPVGTATGRRRGPVHPRRPFSVYTPNGLYPGAPAAAAERVFAPWTDRLVAVSSSEGRLAATRALVPDERIVVIPNGIDAGDHPPAATDLRTRLGLDADVPLVGFIGRLVAQKAPATVVDAAVALRRQRPDAHVVLIGSGPVGPDVEARIRRQSAAAFVHRLPHLPGAAGVMDQLDALVLPSLYEGCPYVALEAMRAGTAVVLSDVTGNRDVVDHGHTGLLFPVGDAASLASAAALLMTDRPLRDRLTAAARTRLAEDFDVSTMARSVVRLYAEAA